MKPEAATGIEVPALSAGMLAGLVWRVRHAVANSISGDYRSVFRGRGMELDQVVKYQWGDDPRDIDWNVTARLGEPYRKRFVEERDLSILLVFEDSPALQFGSGAATRRETLLKTAALLMLIAQANKDRVSLLHVSPAGHWFERALPGRHDILRLVLRMWSQPAPALEGPPRCAIPWTLARRVAARRSVLLWLGPFLSAPLPDGWRELQRRHQTVGVRADDAWDDALPGDARFTVYDPLSGRITTLNTASAAEQAAHRRWREARAGHFSHLFPHQADRIRVHTGADPLAALVAHFHRMSGAGRTAL